MRKILTHIFLMISISAINIAQATETTPTKLIELNTIVAVVNDTPILQSMLDPRVHMVQMQLEAHNVEAPPLKVLQQQVLNQLITEQIQLQLAESRHIHISPFQVTAQIEKIANDQKISIAELYQQANQNGLSQDAYRQQLLDQMIIHELIQTTVATKIVVTPQDVTLYRNSQLARSTAGKEYHIKNILIALPDSPTTEQVKAAEDKAQALLNEIRSGKISFDQAALRDSSGESALQGGDLGFRPLAELPEIFANPIISMKPGDVSGPIRAGNGLQLIELVAIKDNQAQMTDDQIREALFKRKLEETYPVWLASLESQAFIQRNL